MKKPNLSSKGFSLLDVVLSVAIITITAFALMSTYPLAGRLQRTSNQRASLLQARQYLFKFLSRYDAFKRTTDADTTDMACLHNHTACGAGPFTNTFAVYDDTGTIVYNPILPANAAAGLAFGDYNNVAPTVTITSATASVFTCTAASGTAPDATCPIRADIAWTPVCSTCNPAQIKVTVTFSVWDSSIWNSSTGKYGKASSKDTHANFTLYKNVYGAACLLPNPWNDWIFDGETVIGYSQQTAPCAGHSAVLTCNNGTVANIATYKFPSCN